MKKSSDGQLYSNNRFPLDKNKKSFVVAAAGFSLTLVSLYSVDSWMPAQVLVNSRFLPGFLLKQLESLNWKNDP